MFLAAVFPPRYFLTLDLSFPTPPHRAMRQDKMAAAGPRLPALWAVGGGGGARGGGSCGAVTGGEGGGGARSASGGNRGGRGGGARE